MTAPILSPNTQSNSAGVVNIATGAVTTDGAGTPATQTFTCGFTPRYVQWVNATDRITDEWYDGMAADSAIETAANGTRSLETSGGVTVATGAKSFSVDSTIVPNSKVFYWMAIG